MTEASPAIVQPSGQAPVKHLSVGFPIPETSVRIHNKETGEDVEYNEWGNILVKGPQVMKGYHNDEETTKQVNHHSSVAYSLSGTFQRWLVQYRRCRLCRWGWLCLCCRQRKGCNQVRAFMETRMWHFSGTRELRLFLHQSLKGSSNNTPRYATWLLFHPTISRKKRCCIVVTFNLPTGA